MSKHHASGSAQVFILVAVGLAGLTMPWSFTGLSIAFPAIAAELDATPVEMSWVINGYILIFGSTIMAAGSLADRLGRRRIFASGLLLFSATAALLALAPTILALNLLRAAQGVAAALTMAGAGASLAAEFDGHERARAYGVLGTSFGVGLAFGPYLAGLLIDDFGWRSTFVAAALASLAAFVLGVPRMRESRDPSARGVEWSGTILFTAALLVLNFAILEGQQRGWASLLTVGSFAAVLVLLGFFVAVERRHERPMLDLGLFGYARFLSVQALPLALAFGFVVPVVLLPQRLIGIDGFSAAAAGLVLMPLSAPVVVVPLLAALLLRRVSPAVLASGGVALMAAGLALISFVTPRGEPLFFAAALLTIGIGASVPIGIADNLAVSAVPAGRAGMATGIFGTMRAAGEAMALAIGLVLFAGLVAPSIAAGYDAAALAQAASAVASANLERATALLSSPADLRSAYLEAFPVLMRLLAAITLGFAGAVFFGLRRRWRPAMAQS